MGAICARDDKRKDSISSRKDDDRDEVNQPTEVKVIGDSITPNKANDRFSFVPKDHRVHDVYTLFNVEKELGRGASCRVLRVERKSDKKRFAMKEMKKNDRWNPMLFEQEVAILKKLAGNKNILHYEDCYMDRKNFYVCTSLCTGGELFDKIKALKHFSEEQAVDTVRVILEAIKYCHDRNVVHRDLKPENIVYKDKKQEDLVIIDFGDAKEVEQTSVHDDFVGTAFYLAPEAIRTREGWELKKSDLWTIGVIAYVLVTGRPPFWGRENKEIIRKIIRGHFKFPSTIKLSTKCQDFIRKLLVKDCKIRMSADQALKHPWLSSKSGSSKEYGIEILKNLATYGSSNELKKLIVKTVAENLDNKHKREYAKQFNSLDLKNDKEVDYEEVQAFLIKQGVEKDDASLRAQLLVQNISGDTNKPIKIEDWNHSNVAKLLSSSHLIARQYKKLDVDGDGVISADDLLAIFETIPKEEIQEIIDEIDLDQDGSINFEEFRRAMEFKPAYTEADIDNM